MVCAFLRRQRGWFFLSHMLLPVTPRIVATAFPNRRPPRCASNWRVHAEVRIRRRVLFLCREARVSIPNPAQTVALSGTIQGGWSGRKNRAGPHLDTSLGTLPTRVQPPAPPPSASRNRRPGNVSSGRPDAVPGAHSTHPVLTRCRMTTPPSSCPRPQSQRNQYERMRRERSHCRRQRTHANKRRKSAFRLATVARQRAPNPQIPPAE